MADTTPIAPPADLDALKEQAPRHDPALAPQHHPPPLGRQVHALQTGRPITRRNIRAWSSGWLREPGWGYRKIAGALEGIGLCHLQDGNPGEGAASVRQALTIYQRIGALGVRRVQETLLSHSAKTGNLIPASER